MTTIQLINCTWLLIEVLAFLQLLVIEDFNALLHLPAFRNKMLCRSI